MTVDDNRLAEIRERAERATPEPWYAADGSTEGFGGSWDVAGPDHCGIYSVAETAPVAAFPRNPQANAEFGAYARSDIPWLLEVVASLRAENERLKAACGSAQNRTQKDI